MLDHPACFADSVLNADTSVHEYEGILGERTGSTRSTHPTKAGTIRS